ncbi:MAG: chemotaxis protein CheD [Petroclostridium sp.]|jgi:chemotaxis protein CheD|uniref:chemotaxis protein CheD n=1 Tax=Petroclostridium xylanilyticum TaxID=1792311 RepID=UPI000B99C498|nr:chemotaxis protein CheD [Petroclostridium xylanilyticum]MBZ4645886.1 chemotaxis protein [Clostridia bacterium]MDK2809314.1 chemotaxis protein CheD [Petroclostridium sp.]
MDNLVKVGMADLNIAKYPGVLTTLGLGSCVGIALFDPVSKIGGLAHIMLPSSTQVKNNSNKAKFADTAIVELLNMMISAGARKSSIVAKLAGGAQMFSFSQANDIMRIGQRNAAASKEALESLSIPVVAEDTGGNYGRTIELYTENGILLVKTIGYGIKQL